MSAIISIIPLLNILEVMLVFVHAHCQIPFVSYHSIRISIYVVSNDIVSKHTTNITFLRICLINVLNRFDVFYLYVHLKLGSIVNYAIFLLSLDFQICLLYKGLCDNFDVSFFMEAVSASSYLICLMTSHFFNY